MTIQRYNGTAWEEIKVVNIGNDFGGFYNISNIKYYNGTEWKTILAEIDIFPNSSPTGTWDNYNNLNVSGYTLINADWFTSGNYVGNLNWDTTSTSTATLNIDYGWYKFRNWNTIDGGYTSGLIELSNDNGSTWTTLVSIDNNLLSNSSATQGSTNYQTPLDNAVNLDQVKLRLTTGVSYYYDFDGEYQGVCEMRLYNAKITYTP